MRGVVRYSAAAINPRPGRRANAIKDRGQLDRDELRITRVPEEDLPGHRKQKAQREVREPELQSSADRQARPVVGAVVVNVRKR